MAHILFISRYYLPEKAAAAVCVSETAKRLVKLGHDVTVLTTVPNYPSGVVYPEYRNHALQKEVIDGVHVVRVWSYISENKGFFRRIIAQLSFGCIAPLLGGKAVGNPDLLIVESPPLFNVIAAHALVLTKHCPFVFWVADLWPESAVQLGVLRNKLFIKLSEWIEWFTYRHASLIWAISEDMRRILIYRGLAAEKIMLIMNGVDTTKFHPMPKEEARNALVGWDNRFIVLYAGTHGLTHGLSTVLKAAEKLRDHEMIHFMFVGDGAEKASLVAQAQKLRLKNVTFLAPLPHDQMPLLLNAADVCLAHTRKIPLFEGMLPMKMYEAMACGRPLLLALNGEAQRIAVEEAGAALYVEPENADALASTIMQLYAHPNILDELGQRGRAYVQGRFDYDTLTEKLNTQLMNLFLKDIPSSEHEKLTEHSEHDLSIFTKTFTR